MVWASGRNRNLLKGPPNQYTAFDIRITVTEYLELDVDKGTGAGENPRNQWNPLAVDPIEFV